MDAKELSQKPKRRRKKLLVNSRFQVEIIGYFSCIAIFVNCIFYWVISTIFIHLKSAVEGLNLGANHPMLDILKMHRSMVDSCFFITATIFFVAFGIGGLFLSHRIAGPIHNMTQYFKRAQESGLSTELEHITFRKKDFFPELAEEYNGFVESLKGDAL